MAAEAELERRRRKREAVYERWGAPQVPTDRQALFLDSREREVFYGGAAGGGKSSALLMAALEYVHVPGYKALLLRRTFADLSKPGALMDRAREWFSGTAAKWCERDKTWTFPSGASISFGYLEHENDKYHYQGAEYSFCGFDELTQFSESQYTYLFSRLRRLAGSDVPIRMRAASNPGGTGANWVKARFIPDDFTPGKAREPRVFHKEGVTAEGGSVQRAFVPARLEHNPFLDQSDYKQSLDELDAVTREQLLKGDWEISERGNIYPMWDERQHVICWGEFERVFGVRHIPKHWLIGVGQDWGSTEDHPCVTTWVARAAVNGPLSGSVFLFRGLTTYGDTPRQVADKIKSSMKAQAEGERTVQWLMSHEAKSERDTYVVEHGLPFAAWKPDKNGGIAQVRDYLEVRQTDKPHPFRPALNGRPSLYLIVDDAQLRNPKDDGGLARHRAEFAAYRYDRPKSGDAARQVLPYPLFNDAMDSLRGLAAAWFPAIEPMSREERVAREAERRMPGDRRPSAEPEAVTYDQTRLYVRSEIEQEEKKDGAVTGYADWFSVEHGDDSDH